MIATLSKFGANTEAIWMFAGGVLTVFLTTAIILSGISLIKRMLDL